MPLRHLGGTKMHSDVIASSILLHTDLAVACQSAPSAVTIQLHLSEPILAMFAEVSVGLIPR